jgi:hypothetical protein
MTSQGESRKAARPGDGLKGAGVVLVVFAVVIGVAAFNIGGGLPMLAVLIGVLGVGLFIRGRIKAAG